MKLPLTLGLAVAAIGLVAWIPAPARVSPPAPGSPPGGDALDITFTATDGAFVAAPGETVIDLSLAPDGTWSDASSGNGIYDEELWAVVFKFSTIDVPEGATVRFTNHPSRAPVVWLATGNVDIAGTVDVSGQDGAVAEYVHAEPGPGGFRGGTPSSHGFGPGGGWNDGTNDTHAAHAVSGTFPEGKSYGSPGIVPLIGGSGGAGRSSVSSLAAGAGGGALLLATECDLTLSGLIQAHGGNWSTGGLYRSGKGSGGAVRIIADRVIASATTTILATDAVDNDPNLIGRIRVEANEIVGTVFSSPSASGSAPSPVFPADAPSVRITGIDDSSVVHAVPMDPLADLNASQTDVLDVEPGMATIALECENVPTTGWGVMVRVTHRESVLTPAPTTLPQEFPASFVSGSRTSSTWQAQVDLYGGVSALQARAYRLP